MIEMFPDNEVTKLHPNVFIHTLPYNGGIYRVYFNVGVQYFQIESDRDSLESATFIARMLVAAIDKLKKV